MTTLREAAQQALEALDRTEALLFSMDVTHLLIYGEVDNVITALRAALAEPEQEPVAWRTFDGEGGYDYRAYEDNEDYAKQWNARNRRHVGWVEPLYLAPPQRKPLTEEEIMRAFYAAEKTPMSIRHGLSVVEAARIVEKAHGIGEQP